MPFHNHIEDDSTSGGGCSCILTCGEAMMLFSRVDESRGSPDTRDQEDTLLTSSPASDKAGMQYERKLTSTLLLE